MESEKRYFYHIVYDIKSKNGNGVGAMVIDLPNKIKNSKDVTNLREFIQKEKNYENVVIINWIELEG
jgi:3-dehydroquinate synthase class II